MAIFGGPYLLHGNIIISPGISLWIPMMLACSSNKRYEFGLNLMATELKDGQKHK